MVLENGYPRGLPGSADELARLGFAMAFKSPFQYEWGVQTPILQLSDALLVMVALKPAFRKKLRAALVACRSEASAALSLRKCSKRFLQDPWLSFGAALTAIFLQTALARSFPSLPGLRLWY